MLFFESAGSKLPIRAMASRRNDVLVGAESQVRGGVAEDFAYALQIRAGIEHGRRRQVAQIVRSYAPGDPSSLHGRRSGVAHPPESTAVTMDDPFHHSGLAILCQPLAQRCRQRRRNRHDPRPHPTFFGRLDKNAAVDQVHLLPS